jgi:hypothetical protein
MSWLKSFANSENKEIPNMEQKVVVHPVQEEQTIVHLSRFVGNHPRVQLNPTKPFEISKIENGVTLVVNKQAKLPDGEGTQINVTVGDRVSQQAADQLARHNKVIVEAVLLEA